MVKTGESLRDRQEHPGAGRPGDRGDHRLGQAGGAPDGAGEKA
nr:MAG TPA: hypothetical protein [Caudoviricetes sp.]